MKRSYSFAAAAILLAAMLASDVLAATTSGPARDRWHGERTGVKSLTVLRVHGGLSMPTGDFGDAFGTGVGIGADISTGVSRSVLLSAGVAYHSFGGDGFSGDAKVIPITFTATGIFPSSGKVHPWISGGIGLYNVDVDMGTVAIPLFGALNLSASETNFGFNFGAGIAAPAGDGGAWGAGIKFHHVLEGDTFNSLDFITIQGGYGFYL